VVDKDGNVEVQEIDRLDQTADGIRYYFQILAPDMQVTKNHPFGDDLLYVLQDIGPNWVVFGNPGDGAVKQLKISREGKQLTTDVTFEKEGMPPHVVLTMEKQEEPEEITW